MRLTTSLLAVLSTARLSRLVITDDIGQWWIKEPIDRAMDTYAARELDDAAREQRDPIEPWWWRYRSGLDCPFCVGFWLGAAVIATGVIAHRHHATRTAWVLGTSGLALNYVTAHLGSRLGDFDTDDEETP